LITTEKSLLIGVIGGAHGVRGAVRITSFTDNPLNIGDYGALHDEAGHFFVVQPLRLHKNSVIAQIEGITNREQAAGLNGVKLYLEREKLPPTQEEDEFYWQDLIGLAVFCHDGKLLGQVSAMFNFGAGDIVEMKDTQGNTHLIPFSRAAVPVVDLASQRIIIDIDAAGLPLADPPLEGKEQA